MSSRAGKKQLKVWLDASVHEAIKARAEDAGLTISDYVRTRCAKTPARRKRRRPDVKELHRITGQLGKLGSNINQLARRANQSERLPELVELKAIRAQLFEMADQLDTALGYGSKG